MLDILLVTMSLICVFTMFFLAYMMKHHLDVITKLESELAKFKEICSVLNTKKDTLENNLRTGRAGYQELWNKYDESEKNCKIISDIQMKSNDQVVHYMKMVDELVESIDRLVSSYPAVFSTESFGKLYTKLKKRGRLIKTPVIDE